MAESRELTKPVAGLVFVIGWAVGIALWSLSPLSPDAATGGFVVDIGILFVCVASAAPFLGRQKWLLNAVYLAIIGIALAAFGHYVHVDVIVFLVRIIAPLLAVLAPVYKLLGFRIFA